ncbi:unnamed protein product [Rhizophagus irregularis]|nr:unnamed protein product [Rhizophagus irregularis]
MNQTVETMRKAKVNDSDPLIDSPIKFKYFCDPRISLPIIPVTTTEKSGSSKKNVNKNTNKKTKNKLKVWKSPKYEAYIKKGRSINEGSYVCELLAPLLNIVMSDLPGKPIAWNIWGEEGSSASATRKGSRKIAQRAVKISRQCYKPKVVLLM